MHRSFPPEGGTRGSSYFAASRLAGFVLVHSFLVLAGTAKAQKTDSVWIRNGDRISGEVKSVFHGILKYSTDDLSTISIEWDKVLRISSPATFEVQVSSGQKY